MAVLMPIKSPFSTTNPVSGVMSSGLAVQLYTIPGVPHAKPSIVVSPKVS